MFENLLKVIKDKLGVDAATEVQKAIDQDLEAMRDGIATKGLVDSGVLQRLDAMDATLKGIPDLVKAAIVIPEVKLEATEIKMESTYATTQADIVARLTTLETTVKGVVESFEKALQALADQRKSQTEDMPGINHGTLSPDMLAALSKSREAAKETEGQPYFAATSSIRYNE